MKTMRSAHTLLLALVVALAGTGKADDKDLLKSGSAPPNIMVIMSNTTTMAYKPYNQGTTPKLPEDGQYQDSPLSKFGIAKAVLRSVVQTNATKFAFGFTWYAYTQEMALKKHWSYKFTANETTAAATADFPGDVFAEVVGTPEEWGADGQGPILCSGGTWSNGCSGGTYQKNAGGGGSDIYAFGLPGLPGKSVSVNGNFFGLTPAGAACSTGSSSDVSTCPGYAVISFGNNSSARVVAHLLPGPSGYQPYGQLTVTMVKEYQVQDATGKWNTQGSTPKNNPGTVRLTYSAPVAPPSAGNYLLPNTYTTGPDSGLYTGFMRNAGNNNSDWSLNSSCGGWYTQNGMPAIGIPRDYSSDNPPGAGLPTICNVPPQLSYGCVLRYTRPQSTVVRFDGAAGALVPYNPPDDDPGSCSGSLIHTNDVPPPPWETVSLVDFTGSHIPEDKMFANALDYFTNPADDNFLGKVRRDDPSVKCRSGAIILLTDAFQACGPSCGQQAVDDALRQLGAAPHKVPVYVIALGVADDGSIPAKEAHCIARTNGSEVVGTDAVGTWFISSTDQAQVADDLKAAFDAILSKVDESAESFASATVSSVQAGTGQMAFLATFNARKSRSVWDGALRGYMLRPTGGINPENNLNPDGTPCSTTINDPNNPQFTLVLTVPCNHPTILKWNAGMNLAYTPITADVSGVPDLTASSSLSTGSTYSDNSNDTLHSIPLYFYGGRRVLWSLPSSAASAAALPATLPINGLNLEPVPEVTYKFLNGGPSQPGWAALKLLLTPQNVPPQSGSTLGPWSPCPTPPCTITDLDAGQTIRFIRGDRDNVIKAMRTARSLKTFADGDAHYYTPKGATYSLKLGDLFHSNPQLVGEPSSFAYYSGNAHSYTTFYNNYIHRRRVLYAGANDGLLHAFDVGVWGRSTCPDGTTNCYDSGTGAELFAYAPRSVMQNFRRLKEAMGAQDKTDEWTVDGAVSAADVFIDASHAGSPVAANRTWKTIIVGTQREGSPFEGLTTSYDLNCQSRLVTPTEFQNNASSVYALDVTTPEPRDATGKEGAGSSTPPGCLDGASGCTGAWPKVLWEFQDPSKDAGFYHMGESWSKPNLGRICVAYTGGICTDERFVAIFGGGFDRERLNRRGNWLYIVDVETGSVLYKVKSGSKLGGSPSTVAFASMPSEPSTIDVNGDGFLDVLYIGDMRGQMWKLDLTSLSLGSATGRFESKLLKGDGSPLVPFLLFQAPQTDYPTKVYPIYYRPSVVNMGLSSANTAKVGIAFGTGDRDDVAAICPTAATNTSISLAYNQRFYFVVDDSNTATRVDDDLAQIATSSSAIVGSPTLGWVMKLGALPAAAPNTSTAGERTITDSLAVNGYIYFFTAVPSASNGPTACPPPSSCSAAGTQARYYTMYYLDGAPLVPGDRGSWVPNSSFATNPIAYISGNNQLQIGYTTNHGTFGGGRSPASTTSTVKNWKEN